jgi:hypothetical protein
VFYAWLLSVLILTSVAEGQQEKQPAYQLPTPAGWRKEKFALPPSFAPDMQWKGAEELRFAPGTFKANAPDFLSYAFLFCLAGDTDVDARSLERELLAYYRGLASAVSKSKNRNVDAKGFSLTIRPSNPRLDKRPGGEPVSDYSGELNWIEPFATGKPQNLHLEIQSWMSANKHRCVFVCASPQPPTAAVWNSLREIRAGSTCR